MSIEIKKMESDEELPEAGEIFAIYILEEYYGTGVGQALMQAGLDELDYPVVAVWNIVTVLSMCVGRIVFTVLASRK
ncbi:MAG: GNAT family N-acetyltransferase [Butyrivibrio hungatei]|nr:GNAT family N-acetyltransferase [Butyrivibrio hungatei]